MVTTLRTEPMMLDLYGTAAAAYSVRKLRIGYTGPCIRIIRSDLSQIDIGFDHLGGLDETKISLFCGPTGSANVTKWYDQSGNNRDVSASSNFPEIVLNGVIHRKNGKPAVYHPNGTVELTTGPTGATSTVNVGKNYTLAGMVSVETVPVAGVEWLGGGANMYGIYVYPGGNQVAHGLNGCFSTSPSFSPAFATGSSLPLVIHRTGTASFSQYQSSRLLNSSAVSCNNDFLFDSLSGEHPTYNLIGYIQETILWQSDKTSVHSDIIGSMNTYFSYSGSVKKTGARIMNSHGFLPETITFMNAVGISFDEQTYNPSTQYQITGAQYWKHLNDHVKELKGIGTINTTYNFWDKYIALWPIIGGTDSTHKYNLKNPVDSDAAFRLGFTGGTIVHDGAGMRGTGTGYANTFMGASGNLLQNDTSMFRYSNLAIGQQYQMGAYRTTGNIMRGVAGGPESAVNGTITTGTWAWDKWMVNSRISSTQYKMYATGTSVTRISTSSSIMNDDHIHIMSLNSVGVPFPTTDRFCYAGIGRGLTDAEEAILRQIIFDFQTKLNRL